jgi:serine/threonine protein kinase/Flp pilus assembly protein TadD
MELPARFGDYELMAPLAKGGMAEVFLARRLDGEGPAQVCIKRILPSFLQDSDFRAMFADEARLGSLLHHGNIVEVYDQGEVDGRLFIAMEYVHGVTLRKVLDALAHRDEELVVEDAVAVAVQMCQALHYAHTLEVAGRPQHIVHRDVTPGNILLSTDGAAKLMDFGIARAAERITHTMPGLTKGKAPYMSPEQAKAKEIDHRTDQFALAIVLWEMVVGMSLFEEGDGMGMVLQRVASKEAPPPSSLREGVPPPLDTAVLRALDKRPGKRFGDMASFAAALRRSVGGVDESVARERIAELVQDTLDDPYAPTVEIDRKKVGFSTPTLEAAPPSDLLNAMATETDVAAVPRAVTVPDQPGPSPQVDATQTDVGTDGDRATSDESPEAPRPSSPRSSSPRSVSSPAAGARPRTGALPRPPAEDSRKPVLVVAAASAALLLAAVGVLLGLSASRDDDATAAGAQVADVRPASGACGTPPANETIEMSATQLVWKAEDAARSGDEALAAELAREALEVAAVPAAHLVLGRALESERQADARAAYGCAIELAPSSPAARTARAALARMDGTDVAERPPPRPQAGTAPPVPVEDKPAPFELPRADARPLTAKQRRKIRRLERQSAQQLLAGRSMQAIRGFKQIVELEPNNEKAHRNLSMAYRAIGDVTRAEAHGRRADELGPSDSRTIEIRGDPEPAPEPDPAAPAPDSPPPDSTP